MTDYPELQPQTLSATAEDCSPEDGAAVDEDRPAGTDASLNKLDGKLSTALGDLVQQNRKVEEYLEFLAQERRRDLGRAGANQLTLDDIDSAWQSGSGDEAASQADARSGSD